MNQHASFLRRRIATTFRNLLWARSNSPESIDYWAGAYDEAVNAACVLGVLSTRQFKALNAAQYRPAAARVECPERKASAA